MYLLNTHSFVCIFSEQKQFHLRIPNTCTVSLNVFGEYKQDLCFSASLCIPGEGTQFHVAYSMKAHF
jgi:hypothetical protein